MPDPEPFPVEFNELLAAEFNYIAQTAIQANEDRARVSSFYLIAVGSLVAAIFGAQYIEPELLPLNPNLIFGGLFVLLTLMGMSTVLQLARLRLAWYESATAMNQLKDYMIRRNKTLGEAFCWQTSTLPPKYKEKSISYYQTVEVAIISGLMSGTAVFFLQRAILADVPWQLVLPIAVGILNIFIQIRIYKRELK